MPAFGGSSSNDEQPSTHVAWPCRSVVVSLLLALGALWSLSEDADGSPIYKLSTFVSIGPSGQRRLDSSPTVVPDILHDSTGGAPSFASATAAIPAPGALGAGVVVFGTEPGTGGFAEAEAFMRVDDLTIDCAGCPAGVDSVQMHLNLLLTAAFDVGLLGDLGASSSVLMQVQGRVLAPGRSVAVSYSAFDQLERRRLANGAIDRRDTTVRNGWIPTPPPGEPCPSGFLPNCPARSKPFTMRLGEPHVYEASFRARVRASNAFPGPFVGGLDTFGFPTSGPVFDLPPGFTANSEQLRIFDNRWVGAASATVPEPGGLALVALGLAGAGLARRDRRRFRPRAR